MSDSDRNNTLEDEISYWEGENDKIYSQYLVVCTICYTLIGIGGIVAVVVAVLIRRRTESFIVLTSSCFMIFSILITPQTYFTYRSEVKLWAYYLYLCENFFYLAAHWSFSAQYLRTSLILPMLFSEAKLEKACTGNENMAFDFNKI